MMTMSSTRTMTKTTATKMTMKTLATRTSSAPARVARARASSSSSSDDNKGGGLASPAAFNAAAVACAAVTMPTLVYPTTLVRDGLGLECATPLAGEVFETIESTSHFANAFGADAFAVIALAALYTLSDAAANSRLKSETYQRLALAVVLYTGSLCVAFDGAYLAHAAGVVDGPAPNAVTAAAITGAFLPAFVTSISAIRTYGPGHDATWARVGADFALVKNLGDRTEQGGYLELFYKVSFWTSMVVGGSFAFSPLSPLAIVNESANVSAQLVQRSFGLSTVFMLAPAQMVLIDACRRGRLGGGTFKKLNLSIAVAIALIDWMTIYTFGEVVKLSPSAEQLSTASGGMENYVAALSVSFSIAAVYLYQGVFAKK